MDESGREIVSIFGQALEHASVEDRQAFLKRACPDAGIRAHVEALLQAHLEAGDFLKGRSAADVANPTLDAPVLERPGTVIGPYKLLQQIGEGGMGTVFMAEQTQPVQRRVALKIIKPGMDSRQVIARFEAERQALALMDHPNIAKVLDAGQTAGGLPFFVMELVNGMAITKYCDERQLSPAERLQLFLPVCHAVQHAHQKGIIHRDLKPSNVLIALYDGKPVPKVIDFGVAKATGPKLTDRTMFTEFGQVVGTLEYMSPEQAEQNQLDVDTRSDIYALGVLLYELLTGTTPLQRKRLKNAALLELLRIIREEEPQRPSTRLSTTEELPSIAAKRSMEPKKLSGLVRGELDWIVMKCLEKDRNRRYETANGLALDIQRYLHDDTVLACPPSTWYRLRKLVRRNKGVVLAGTLLFLALFGGVVGTSWGLVVANRARVKAEADEQRATTAEGHAKDEAAIAKEVGNFLQQDLLLQADSDEQANQGFPVDPNLTVKEALNRAAARIGDRFQQQPLVEAAIRRAIANAYRAVGSPALGIPHLERAVALRQTQPDPDQLDTMGYTTDLANIYHSNGEFDRALVLHEKVLSQRKRVLGHDHLDVLISMNNLAFAYQYSGQIHRAIALYEEALTRKRAVLGPDNKFTIGTINNLAEAYRVAGNLDKAFPLYFEALAKMNATIGPDHPFTLTTMNNLAVGYQDAGRLDEAVPLYERTLPKLKERFGPDHPTTLNIMNNLASAYYGLAQYDRAVPLYEETLAKKEAKLGPSHPQTLISLNNLAMAYLDMGQHERAVPLLEQTVEKFKAKFGPDHPDTLTTMHNLASTYVDVGRTDHAVPLFEAVLAKRTENLGPDHPYTLSTMNGLALAFKAAGRLDRAVPLFGETLVKLKAKLGPDHPNTLTCMHSLGMSHKELGHFDKAVAILEDVAARRKQKLGADHPQTADSRNGLALTFQANKQPEKAESLLRESLEIQGKKAPDDWSTFNVASLLGDVLLDLKKFSEAEPHLLRGYEGLKQRLDKIPATHKHRVTEAVVRLVRLYDAWGKSADAAKWRKELEAHKMPTKMQSGPPGH